MPGANGGNEWSILLGMPEAVADKVALIWKAIKNTGDGADDQAIVWIAFNGSISGSFTRAR
jgi:hypothetical protein